MNDGVKTDVDDVLHRKFFPELPAKATINKSVVPDYKDTKSRADSDHRSSRLAKPVSSHSRQWPAPHESFKAAVVAP